jgi:uncharacterized protein YcaQ
MSLLQIDTISVVNRSPYFVLWSRLGAYEPGWLDELHAEGALFEDWAHGACFLPIEDYPLFRAISQRRPARWKSWITANPDVTGAGVGAHSRRRPVALGRLRGG